MNNNKGIEPYDCVEVPRQRVSEFLHEPFAALWDAADSHGFKRTPHTTMINCERDTALLRSCRWTDKPLILKENW